MAFKSFSATVSSCMRYLKEVTASSGCLYDLKSVADPTHASSCIILRIFRYATHVQRAVVGWRRLSYSQGTNIYQSGHKGCFRLPSSIITIVSRTRWFKNRTRRLVSIVTLPLHPSNGHPTNSAALGKEILQILLSSCGGVVSHWGREIRTMLVLEVCRQIPRC